MCKQFKKRTLHAHGALQRAPLNRLRTFPLAAPVASVPNQPTEGAVLEHSTPNANKKAVFPTASPGRVPSRPLVVRRRECLDHSAPLVVLWEAFQVTTWAHNASKMQPCMPNHCVTGRGIGACTCIMQVYMYIHTISHVYIYRYTSTHEKLVVGLRVRCVCMCTQCIHACGCIHVSCVHVGWYARPHERWF